MAYISHSPIRDLNIPGVNGAVLARSALVAVAAVGVMLALSEAKLSTPAAPPPAAKADRVAAPVVAAAVSATYVVDTANATTTVERGATVPLSANSPMLDAAAK